MEMTKQCLSFGWLWAARSSCSGTALLLEGSGGAGWGGVGRGGARRVLASERVLRCHLSPLRPALGLGPRRYSFNQELNAGGSLFYMHSSAP